MKLIAAVLMTLLAGIGFAAETPPAVQPPTTPCTGTRAPPRHADVGNVKVPKATGPDARTVAEIVARAPSSRTSPWWFAARS